MAEDVSATSVGVFRTIDFRTIDELAARCGNYCWLENRLFELTGKAASSSSEADDGPGEAEVRVFLSALAYRHASLATQWRDRLPVRAGVDADALVVPPAGAAATALDLLAAQPDPVLVLSGLVEQILPRLLTSYAEDRAQAPAVSEAPVRAVLGWACFCLACELEEGPAALRRAARGRGRGEKGGALRAAIAEAFEGEPGILPAAWAS